MERDVPIWSSAKVTDTSDYISRRTTPAVARFSRRRISWRHFGCELETSRAQGTEAAGAADSEAGTVGVDKRAELG